MIGVRLAELAMRQGGEAANQTATRATVHKKNPMRAYRWYAPVAQCYTLLTRISRSKKKGQNYHYSGEQQLNPLMSAKALFEIIDCFLLFVHRPALARAPIAIETAL